MLVAEAITNRTQIGTNLETMDFMTTPLLDISDVRDSVDSTFEFQSDEPFRPGFNIGPFSVFAGFFGEGVPS